MAIAARHTAQCRETPRQGKRDLRLRHICDVQECRGLDTATCRRPVRARGGGDKAVDQFIRIADGLADGGSDKAGALYRKS